METNISHSEPKELDRAQQLLEEGKYDEALLFVKNIEENKDLTALDELLIPLLKSSILIRIGNYEESYKFAEKAYQESQVLKKHLYSIDALANMSHSLLWLGDLDKASDLIVQSEDILRTLTRISPIDREKREANIASRKASVCWFKGDANQGLPSAKKSLELREKRGNKYEIVESLFQIGVFHTFLKGDLDLALKYAERCQALAEEINHQYVISHNLANFGVISALKGEINESLMYYEQVLPIFEKNNNTYMFNSTLHNIGNVYIQKGNLDQALVYLVRALEALKKTRSTWQICTTTTSIIEVLVFKGEIEQAQRYLEQLEGFNKQMDNKWIKQSYLFSKALVLKTSPRIHNRAKAIEIFKQIVQEETEPSEGTIMALLNLCELLLDELRITNEQEILDEIEPLITQLLDIAEKSNSYWVLAETKLLQAKLALLTLDLKGARRLITQAQQIAEKYGMHRLAAKISIEHDNLLKDLSLWEKLMESKAPLSERLELANLKEQVKRMAQKRTIEVPESSVEEPVTILIITEGGKALFSHSFIKEKPFESHLFGGFLTTMDYFIKEMFSEGLDRAIFGQYTLLMKSISPFLICYIFKGDSYYAHQRIKYFIDHIQKEDAIWQNLIKFFQTNQSIHFKDIPLLESLITEIFINKDVLLSTL